MTRGDSCLALLAYMAIHSARVTFRTSEFEIEVESRCMLALILC